MLSTIGMTDSLEESPFYSWVSVDDFAESYKMTDYLCKLGHKRILILAATKDDESIGRLRLEGYRKALKDNGIELDEDLCVFSGVGRDCYTMDYGFMAMSLIPEEKRRILAAKRPYQTVSPSAPASVNYGIRHEDTRRLFGGWI